jgi:hypothetical protein
MIFKKRGLNPWLKAGLIAGITQAVAVGIVFFPMSIPDPVRFIFWGILVLPGSFMQVALTRDVHTDTGLHSPFVAAIVDWVLYTLVVYSLIWIIGFLRDRRKHPVT